MSDFDEFFEEKMNQEQRFPGRQKSWNGLEKRLDAFDAGAAGTSPTGRGWLRFWQLATLVGLFAGGWFLMENDRLSVENAALKMERSKAEIQPTTTGNQPSISENHPAKTTDFKNEKTGGQPRLRPLLASPSATHHVNESSISRPLLASPPTTHRANESSIFRETPAKWVVGEDANNGQNGQQSIVGEDADDSKKVVAAGDASHSQIENLQAEISRLSAEKAAIQQQLDEKQAELNQKLVAEQAAFAEKLAAEKARFDSLQTVAATIAAAPPALINPAKNVAKFRLGADYLTGLATPKVAGVSRLSGHSFSGEWRFRRNFSAAVGADFLNYSVCTMDFPKHQHFPDPPKPSQNHPDHEITNVESTREQQIFSLGIKYSAPFGNRFIRPTVGLTHSWVRLPSTFVSYKFEDKKGGGGPGPGPGKEPETITQKTDNQWVTNVWRLGLGFEHERQRVVFRVGADWNKNLKKDKPLFDSLMLRGGLSFKF